MDARICGESRIQILPGSFSRWNFKLKKPTLGGLFRGSAVERHIDADELAESEGFSTLSRTKAQ
jgi:hypothetical protein